ncbi:MAG: UMP kinase, partial [Thermoplasmatales archaeon]|nr:UMP kinase [Thermoplasmatales archaeon]
METIVISIGGSVILSEDADVSFFNKLKTLLEKLTKNYKIYLVVGGGKTARTYIKLGRKLNFEEEFLDEIGIDVTRANAKLLTNIFGISNEEIPATTDKAKDMVEPIVVMGGTTPGHSTDMVGAELAEKTNATKFIIATNVDGVYDKDPNKYKDATQIKEISVKQLIAEYGTGWNTAGKNIVIDGPALEIINRAKIPTFV